MNLKLKSFSHQKMHSELNHRWTNADKILLKKGKNGFIVFQFRKLKKQKFSSVAGSLTRCRLKIEKEICKI